MANSRFRVKKGLTVATTGNPSGSPIIPVGSIIMWSSNSAVPDGFLACEGGTVSRSTYANLNSFLASLSTPYPYGSGDGSTTFGLPDFRGRFPNGTFTASQIGQTSGAESVTLATANIPNHLHDVTAHTHTNGSMNAESNAHSHSWNYNSGGPSGDHAHNYGAHGHAWRSETDIGSGSTRRATTSSGESWFPFASAPNAGGTGGPSSFHAHGATMNTTGIYVNHTHSFNTGGPSTNTDNGNTSGGAFAGTPISLIQPYLAVRFIIKY